MEADKLFAKLPPSLWQTLRKKIFSSPSNPFKGKNEILAHDFELLFVPNQRNIALSKAWPDYLSSGVRRTGGPDWGVTSSARSELLKALVREMKEIQLARDLANAEMAGLKGFRPKGKEAPASFNKIPEHVTDHIATLVGKNEHDSDIKPTLKSLRNMRAGRRTLKRSKLIRR
jgi:hypothetical protein